MDNLEMCREADVKAAHEWAMVAQKISIDDFKLDRLFEFERDQPALSTRTTRLKCRHAFLEGFDYTAKVMYKPQVEQSNAVRIEGERADKFHSLLADMADAALSLRTAAKLFPKQAVIIDGELFPTATTIGYAMVLDDMIGDVMELANGDDLKGSAREVGHAQD